MAGVLARLQVQDVDAPASCSSSSATTTTATTLFVRCRQKALASSTGSHGSSTTTRLPVLHLDVAEGHALWRGEVTEEHKPLVLDCSASEYLDTLESVFNARATAIDGAGGDSKRAFAYKWSRKNGVLTLMEGSASGFTMKYTSLTLTPMRDDNGDSEKQAIWTSLLQEVVDVSAHTAQETTRQKARIDALETLLKEKDAVLETALLAKQQLEDQLFEGFWAVLNAKKDEIQRLQHEVAVAQVQVQSSLLSNSNGKTNLPKKPRQLQAAKAKGAKLKRKLKAGDDGDDDEEEGQGSSSEEEEADSQDDDESDSQGESDEDDDDDEVKRPSRSHRVKCDAIDAHSQLPSSIHSSSQVCTADDVLSDLGTIMKQEVEANDAIQAQADNNNTISDISSRTKRPRALASASSARRTQEKKRKSEASSQDDDEDNGEGDGIKKNQASMAKTTKPNKAEPAIRPPPPAPVKAIDSEEDILDMLA